MAAFSNTSFATSSITPKRRQALQGGRRYITSSACPDYRKRRRLARFMPDAPTIENGEQQITNC